MIHTYIHTLMDLYADAVMGLVREGREEILLRGKRRPPILDYGYQEVKTRRPEEFPFPYNNIIGRDYL